MPNPLDVIAAATLIIAAAACQRASAAPLFINELHYDNAGRDIGEFIEIAGPSGADLTGWSLVLYNGSNGKPYRTESLSGVLDDEGKGLGAIAFLLPGIQNGAPDGIALIDDTANLVQLLSYEGEFTAIAGPAAGATSQKIRVQESGAEPAGLSLQLLGRGSTTSGLEWGGPLPSSFGSLNPGQMPPASTVPEPASLPLMGLALATLTFLQWRKEAGLSRERSRLATTTPTSPA